MVINPIAVQGEITRAQDFTTIKHNEDNKGMVDQLNIQKQQQNQEDSRAHQVQKKDDPESAEKRYDAKEKGNNQYTGNGGKQRKKEEQKKSDGKVVLKNQSGFDMKI